MLAARCSDGTSVVISSVGKPLLATATRNLSQLDQKEVVADHAEATADCVTNPCLNRAMPTSKPAEKKPSGKKPAGRSHSEIDFIEKLKMKKLFLELFAKLHTNPRVQSSESENCYVHPADDHA